MVTCRDRKQTIGQNGTERTWMRCAVPEYVNLAKKWINHSQQLVSMQRDVALCALYTNTHTHTHPGPGSIKPPCACILSTRASISTQTFFKARIICLGSCLRFSHLSQDNVLAKHCQCSKMHLKCTPAELLLMKFEQSGNQKIRKLLCP